MWFNSRLDLSRPEHVFGPPTGPPLSLIQKPATSQSHIHAQVGTQRHKHKKHTHIQTVVQMYLLKSTHRPCILIIVVCSGKRVFNDLHVSASCSTF